jgi:hypothetical protein
MGGMEGGRGRGREVLMSRSWELHDAVTRRGRTRLHGDNALSRDVGYVAGSEDDAGGDAPGVFGNGTQHVYWECMKDVRGMYRRSR